MGVQAIFGPSDPVLGAHIYSICDALDIPYLDSRIDTHTMRATTTLNRNQNISNKREHLTSQNDGIATTTFSPNTEFTINLNPTQLFINNAFQDVMRFLNWTKVAIIYEKSFGLYSNDNFYVSIVSVRLSISISSLFQN